MRVIIQRVLEAHVSVNQEIVGKIDQGCVLFVGFQTGDNEATVAKLVKKLDGLRIFEDEAGKMNLALKEVSNSFLSISQFSLYASLKKGKRPSFDQVMPPQAANALYQHFNTLCQQAGYHVETGVFQADMKVHLVNDGPLTFILDSEEI